MDDDLTPEEQAELEPLEAKRARVKVDPTPPSAPSEPDAEPEAEPAAAPTKMFGEGAKGALVWLAIVIGIVMLLAWMARDEEEDDGVDLGTGVGSSLVTVVYDVTGTATQADITYQNSGGNAEQQSAVDVPLQTTTGRRGLRATMRRGDFVYISAQNPNDDGGSITCTITADGQVIESSTSHGSFTIVTCSGQVP